MAEISLHYPSFYSHHYEKCDGEEEEMGTEVMVENRLNQYFCCCFEIIKT